MLNTWCWTWCGEKQARRKNLGEKVLMNTDKKGMSPGFEVSTSGYVRRHQWLLRCDFCAALTFLFWHSTSWTFSMLLLIHWKCIFLRTWLNAVRGECERIFVETWLSSQVPIYFLHAVSLMYGMKACSEWLRLCCAWVVFHIKALWSNGAKFFICAQYARVALMSCQSEQGLVHQELLLASLSLARGWRLMNSDPKSILYTGIRLYVCSINACKTSSCQRGHSGQGSNSILSIKMLILFSSILLSHSTIGGVGTITHDTAALYAR